MSNSEITKHTPGPWSVPNPIIEGSGLAFSPVFATTLIARVYSTAYGDHAQSEANARLMSAAPELLDIAQTIVAICEGGKYADLACMEGSPLVDAAREAIAKATGIAA